MADAGSTSGETAKPRLGPRSKIVIPEAFTKSSSNGRTASVAPASERTAQETGLPQAAEPAVVAEVAAPAPADAAVVSPKPEPSKPSFAPISPGLSSVKLPLGPSPKNDSVSGLCGVSYHAAVTYIRCNHMDSGGGVWREVQSRLFSVQFRGEPGSQSGLEARRMSFICHLSWG